MDKEGNIPTSDVNKYEGTGMSKGSSISKFLPPFDVALFEGRFKKLTFHEVQSKRFSAFH